MRVDKPLPPPKPKPKVVAKQVEKPQPKPKPKPAVLVKKRLMWIEKLRLQYKKSKEKAAGDAAKERPISFKLDIMLVFMKAGGNTGSCHGAAWGKDGFRLSLFGFDPDGDYHRLTCELSGRRINLALVDDSLVLEKGSGRVTHTGGERFEEVSEVYATIRWWLEDGVPKDGGNVARPVSMELYPSGAVLDGKDFTQQVTLRGKYSDGTDRDVTSLASFLSNNETAAKVSSGGLVTAEARGEAFIMRALRPSRSAVLSSFCRRVSSSPFPRFPRTTTSTV